METHVLDSPLGPRRIDVWLPADASGPLPVVYAHDGQNVFDPATSTLGVPWALDRAVERLGVSKRLPGAVVVAMWHGEQRYREYLPALPAVTADADADADEHGGPPQSDELLDFVAGELKAFVDERYPTATDAASTILLGSSMGAVSSLYGVCRHPGVFGGAACLSTHWPAGGEVLVDAMAAALPPPGTHRLYFDHGTEGLDAAYAPFQARFDAHLERLGYRFGRDCLSCTFEGAGHDERAWAARVDLPLGFLLSRSDGGIRTA